MAIPLLARMPQNATPIVLIADKTLAKWLKTQPSRIATWIKTQNFKASPGSFCLVPDMKGKVSFVVGGISEPPSLWDIADFSTRLPSGSYFLKTDIPVAYREWLALGWTLGTHSFSRYKEIPVPRAKLVLPDNADGSKIERYASSICLARDLITTPAEDMGPEQLAAAVTHIGKNHKAKVTEIIGDDLLKKNYPAIHRVGRASYRAPRLCDLSWTGPNLGRTPLKVTLIGKGICFDTGGLDLKPSSAMYMMKKDMGGAACALAVAAMIMGAGLPLKLRLLVPIAENAIGSKAYRPQDVITMRNKLTVEVGNTDAEGRLVLADALAEAATENPDLLIDFATLTGAARGALGMDVPALFCNDDDMADALLAAGQDMEDPLWRMPLHKSYAKMLDSSIADLNSCPNSPYAGAITAALFLQRFIGATKRWAHIDLGAYNLSTRPGRPEGGEGMAVRAIFRFIESYARDVSLKTSNPRV